MRISCSQPARLTESPPLNIEIPPESLDLTHAIVALLTQMVLLPRSSTASVPSEVFFPVRVWMSLGVDRAGAPITIFHTFQ